MSSRTDLLGLEGEWLLLLTVSGQTFRFATIPVEVEDRGRVLRFDEGLGDLQQGVSGDGSPTSSISVEVIAGEAWAAIVANFATFERSTAELRRWFPGQTLTQTRLILSGLTQGLAYGEPDQAVSFSITRDIRTQSRTLPSAGMVVDESTWPVRAAPWAPDESILGAPYPIVIGYPGATSGGATYVYEGLLFEVGGTPARLSRVMVAGHQVVATSVLLADLTDELNPATDTRTVLEVQDLVGRTISYVEVGPNLPTPDPGRIYYIGHDLATGGGLRNPRKLVQNEPLRGAADVIEWLITTWTDVRFDAARFAAVKDRLNLYKIDTWWNDPSNPMDLVDKLVAWLPVEPKTGEDGLYYYLRPTEGRPIEASAHLDADVGEVDRVSLIQMASDEIVNEVTIEYQPKLAGRYARRVTVSADTGVRVDELDPALGDDVRIQGSYRAKLSQQIYGRQPVTLALDDVWDTSTAVLVAQDILAQQALPRRYVDYEGPPNLEALEAGTLITINDSTVGLQQQLALLFDLTVGGDTVTLHLELIDDPTITTRFTG